MHAHPPAAPVNMQVSVSSWHALHAVHNTVPQFVAWFSFKPYDAVPVTRLN